MHPLSPASTLAPPELRLARFEDYPQIQQLEKSHGLLTFSEDDWRRLWLDNPLWERLSNRWPIGWVLENANQRIVGSMVNIPFSYSLRGRELISACGRGWVVNAEYRGAALWIMDEYFNQEGVDLFINTMISPMSIDVLSAYSDRCPVGNWDAASFFVTAYRGFARTALRIKKIPFAGLLAYPAAAAMRIKVLCFSGSLAGKGTSAEVAEASAFDARFNSFWQELIRQYPEKLLAFRDARSLAWHFRIPMRQRNVWIYTAARNGLLRAYCIFKREDQFPGMQGLRRMRLVDFQTLEPNDDLLPCLLRPALRRCAAESIHVLEHVGCDLPKMKSFDRFAPYRRKLPSWKYFFKAMDSGLDAELHRAELWEPSMYDGDASIE